MFDTALVSELLAQPAPPESPLHWQEGTHERIQYEEREWWRMRRSVRLSTTATTTDFASPSHFMAVVLRDLMARQRIQNPEGYLKPPEYPDYAPEGVAYLLHRANKELRLPPVRGLVPTASSRFYLTSHHIEEPDGQYGYAGHTTLIVVETGTRYHAVFYRQDSVKIPKSQPIPLWLYLKERASYARVHLFLILCLPFLIVTIFFTSIINRIKYRNIKPDYWPSVEEVQAYEKAYRELDPLPAPVGLPTKEQFLVDKALAFIREQTRVSSGRWRKPLCFIGELSCLEAVKSAAILPATSMLFTNEEWRKLREQGLCYLPVASYEGERFDQTNPKYKDVHGRLMKEGLQFELAAEYWLFTESHGWHGTGGHGYTELWRWDGERWLYVTTAESWIN